MDTRLCHPFSMLVSGTRGSGKTEFVKKLLRFQQEMIHPPIEKVIWCYGKHQPKLYDDLMQLKTPVSYIKGFPNNLSSMLDLKTNSLVVLDDMMDKCREGRIAELFFKGRHDNMSVVYLTQDLFHKDQRLISLNSDFMVIFKNPRDASQFTHLAKQVRPHNIKFLQHAYQDAVEKPYSYLFLDLHPTTPEEHRVRARIFPDQFPQYIYQEPV